MEKSSSTITQELVYLKKSLKNKRNSQKWEQCIQYYRNNQSSLTNYHLLQIIKIAIKTLKNMLYRSCKYLSKLSNLNSKHPQDKKISDEIQESKKSLVTKLHTLASVIDSYTLTLQSILICSDQHYFNMMFRADYKAYHSLKQLIFEPIKTYNEHPCNRTVLEYQMFYYLNLIGKTSILYCITQLYLQPEKAKLSQTINKIQSIVGRLCQSSYCFSRRKMEFQIVKLNVISKFGTGLDLKVRYYLPVEEFYTLYKNHQKWAQRTLDNLYMLLIRYLFLTLQIISSKSQSISIIFPDSSFITDSEINTETQIYIFMKEMLLINEKIRKDCKQNQGILGMFLQYMSIAVVVYEAKMEQLGFWKELLGRFFQYGKLDKIGGKNQPLSIKQNIKNVMAIFLQNKSQDNQKQLNIIHLLRKQTNHSQTTKRHQKVHKKQKQQQTNKQLNTYFTTVFSQIFNYIDQSDSDSDSDLNLNQNKYQNQCSQNGKMKYLFQKKRKEIISEIEKERIKRKYKGVYKGEGKEGVNGVGGIQIGDVRMKLGILREKSEKIRKQAHNAIALLTNRRQSIYQSQKIQKTNQPLSLQPIPEFPILKIPKSKPNQKKKTLSLALPLVKKPSFLPLTLSSDQQSIMIQKKPQKRNQQPQDQNPIQAQTICLSDKYDKMSRNLLLSNTNNVYNHISASHHVGGIHADQQYQYGDRIPEDSYSGD